MVSPVPVLTTQKLVRAGFRDLLKPPFRALLLLTLFLTLASDSFGNQIDDTSAFLSLLLVIVSAYLQIAITLAAAELQPSPSADFWVRAAFKQRVFWRYMAASLIVVLMLVAGFVLLIIPGLILCGVLALAQPAAILERRGPVESIRRSALLTEPARRPLAAIFFLLVLLPNLTLQAGLYGAGAEDLAPGWVALDLVTVVLYMGAAIALARAFIALRPTEEPPNPQNP
jgi:hypothetical protein